MDSGEHGLPRLSFSLVWDSSDKGGIRTAGPLCLPKAGGRAPFHITFARAIIRRRPNSASLLEQRGFKPPVSFALSLCESGLEKLRLKKLPKSTIKLDI